MDSLGRRPRAFFHTGLLSSRRAMAWLLVLLFAAFATPVVIMNTRADQAGPAAHTALDLVLLACYAATASLIAFRAGGRAEDALEFAPRLIEDMPVGVVIADGEYRVVYANPSFARMLGRPVAEVEGRSVVDLVLPQDRALFDREAARRRQGASDAYFMRFQGPGGAPAHALVHATPFLDQGRFDGVLALVHDVSDSLTAKEEAARHQNTERLLFDAVTHDISNSVQTVVGHAQLAAAFARQGSPKALEIVARTAEAAKRTAALVREVKQVAVAERERWPVGPTRIMRIVERGVEGADLGAGAFAVTQVEASVALLEVDANGLAPLAISKLLEQAGSGVRPSDAPLPVTVVVRQGELGLSSLVVEVHGYSEPGTAAQAVEMLAGDTFDPTPELAWRSGVKLMLAAAVAEGHRWTLHARVGDDGKRTVFELRMPTRMAVGHSPAEPRAAGASTPR